MYVVTKPVLAMCVFLNKKHISEFNLKSFELKK